MSFTHLVLYSLHRPRLKSRKEPCPRGVEDDAAVGTNHKHAALDAGTRLPVREPKQPDRLPELELVVIVQAVPGIDVPEARARRIRDLVHTVQVFHGMAAVLELNENDASPLPRHAHDVDGGGHVLLLAAAHNLCLEAGAEDDRLGEFFLSLGKGAEFWLTSLPFPRWRGHVSPDAQPRRDAAAAGPR